MVERKYPCEFCDTELEQVDKLVTLTMQRKGRWYIFENAPAQVCPNCGHRYFDGPTLLKLEKMTKDRPDSARQVEAWSVSLPAPGE
jgi:YgiT-type zinc finger domain-containing protein